LEAHILAHGVAAAILLAHENGPGCFELQENAGWPASVPHRARRASSLGPATAVTCP